jgi:diguanylate cyclase (GGDEF)-like protein
MLTPSGFATRLTDVLACAFLVAIAIVGIVFRHVSLTRFFILAPTLYFGAVFIDLITTGVLVATSLRSTARRSSFLLATVFAANAALTTVALLVFPIVPNNPPVIIVARGIGTWSYAFLHFIIAAGAFVYAGTRNAFDDRPLSQRFRLISSACAIALVVAAVTAAIVFGGGAETGLHASGLAPLFGALLGVSALVVFRVRTPDVVDRAFALALVALTLESLFIVVGHRYDASYYAGRLLLALSSTFVLVAAVRMLIASQLRLGMAEQRVSLLEGEATRRADRIRALWRIASEATPADDERARHILEIATAALRPDLQLLGCLSHRNGDTLVVDATSSTITGSAAAELAAKVYPGATFPIARSIVTLLETDGTTQAWDDLGFIQGRDFVTESIGWQCFIGARFTLAREQYFVTFTSPQPTTSEPFAEHDLAFVDVVASFLASHVTQQSQYERIQFQIEHDALTGLENRVQFRRRVREEIATGRAFTVAFADLDGFRHLNEREGHQIGDELLVEVAAEFRSIDHANTIARTSGDEFGIVIRSAGSVEAATAALERYAARFREPFHTGDRDGTRMITVGASFGAARFPADGSTAEQLMLRSDTALGIAKGRGGSAAMLFDQRMESIIVSTQLRVVELGNAITGGELALVYQPTFDLAHRGIVGAEALVRWDHPKRGRLAPAEFIGFAERNGLMGGLSRWVLDRLVRDLTQTTPLPAGFRISFNLAATMLESFPFIARLNEVVRASPELVEHLGIEVTESAAMQNVERSMSTIDLFRSWGLAVAIDDFGTGYSSLSYLKQLNVDLIKIDQSFVAGVADDERDAAVAEMLIRITERFGFTTLAEGIETEAQAAWLLERGCRLGQGYLVGHPDSFGELIQRLSETDAA